MTAYPSIPNAAAAVRLGASDYITKPFTPEQITQSVRRMLARDARGENESEGPRLPGTLDQDTTAEYVSATGVSASKVATLVVQPVPSGHGVTGLDERTIAFLAEHIVQEMASC